MNFRILFGLWAFILVLSFRSSNTSETRNFHLEKILSGFNKFSVNFYKTLAKDTPGNFISSGLSAYMLLLFITYSTIGETQQQLAKALNVAIDDNPSTVVDFSKFVTKIRNTSNFELFFANALFIQSLYPSRMTFTQLCLEMNGIDFGDVDKAVDIINSWSQQKTDNKITNLIQSSNLQDINLVVATTAFFKGTWMNPFPHFQDINFYLSERQFTSFTMMCNTQAKYNYGLLPNIDAQYIELPYQTDDLENKFSMYIILPHKLGTVNTIIKKLNNGNFKKLESAKRDLIFCMPKFRIVKKLNLIPIFKNMGISNIFNNLGNFTYIQSIKNLKITTLIQKTIINANENGTEPDAAFTSSLWLGPMDKPAIYINRPFIVAIVSKISGSPLFFARVKYPRPELKPSKNSPLKTSH